MSAILSAISGTVGRIEKVMTTPQVLATTETGQEEIDPRALMRSFMAAVEFQKITEHDPLFGALSIALPDPEQGLIYECLRKLAQGEEPVKGEDLFLPSGKSREFLLTPPKRLNVMWGAVRSSKSVTADLYWLNRIANNPRAKPWMIGQTLDTLRDNVINPLEDLLPAAIDYTTGWRECYIFGVKCKLRSASSKAQDKKLKGGTMTDLYGDEMTTWPENVTKMALSRLSTPGATGIFTTNPEDEDHYTWRDFLSPESQERLNAPGLGGIRTWQFYLPDNPSLTPEYIASLKAEYPEGTVWHSRLIQGRWVIAEGRIWDFFRPDVGAGYVVDARDCPRAFLDWVVSIDYGTSDAFAAGLYGLAQNPSQNALRSWFLVGEYYYDPKEHRGRQKAPTEYIEDLIKLCRWKGHPIYPDILCDPSAAAFITECRRSGRAEVENIRGADNSVKDGILDVATMLSQGWLKISSDCPNAIKYINNYRWDENSKEEKPLHDGSHFPDALRYGCRYMIRRMR
jgi:PBSX family phage terminase large subunit